MNMRSHPNKEKTKQSSTRNCKNSLFSDGFKIEIRPNSSRMRKIER